MSDRTIPPAAALAGYTLWLLAFPMGGPLLGPAAGPSALFWFLVPHIASLYAASWGSRATLARWTGASGALALAVTAAYPLWPHDPTVLLAAAGLFSGPVAVRAGAILRGAADPLGQAAVSLVSANVLLAGLGSVSLPHAAQFAVAALALAAPCLMRPRAGEPAGDEARPASAGDLFRALPFLFSFHLVSGLFYGSLMPAYERVRVLPAVELAFYIAAVFGALRLVRRDGRGALTCAILLGMLSLAAFHGAKVAGLHLSMFAMQASAGFMDLFVLGTLLRQADPVRAFGVGLSTLCLGILGGNVAAALAAPLPGGVTVVGSMALNLALLTLHWLGRREGEAPLGLAAARRPAPAGPSAALLLPPGLQARLSAMERSVLEMVVEGRTFRDAAAALGVSESTVKTYMRRIYEKAGVSGKPALLDKLARQPPPGPAPRTPPPDELPLAG